MILDLDRRLYENPRERIRIISTFDGISGALIDFYGNIISDTEVLNTNYSFQETVEKFDDKNGTNLISIINPNLYLTTVLEDLFRNQPLSQDKLHLCCLFYVAEKGKNSTFTFKFGDVSLDCINERKFDLTNTFISSKNKNNFIKAYKKAKVPEYILKTLSN